MHASGRRGLHIAGALGGAAALAALVWAYVLVRPPSDAELAAAVLAAHRGMTAPHTIVVTYPAEGTQFPPDIAPPAFTWRDAESGAARWLVSLACGDRGERVNALCDSPSWTPAPPVWDAVVRRSAGCGAAVTILGLAGGASRAVVSEGRVGIAVSPDPVEAPIFYREVILPFIDAVKDPSRIRWRFGPVSSLAQPPVVLERLPVCGNCHSFSRDGATLAMDVDYANSKASYIVTKTAPEMTLATGDIFSWNEYRKEDGEQTFGLLSQISPDGRYVVSTVKDRSVFVPRPDLAFSQLFFPIKGILCVYDRAARTFRSLPGADDPRFVQSNPVWSPDGRHVLFARSAAHTLAHARAGAGVLLKPEECEEFLAGGAQFKFDIYRIPFNGGRGGTPVPLAGASGDGTSNYFPRCSPDGRWIVFCKSRSYMLLQPDSELYIVPAEGGTARRLECNTARMNSWHSWSPNGKWLVFSSKAGTPYTRLWLAHIDAEGRSSPPVLLSRFTAPDRAANIPEFVNAPPAAIARIRERFLDDYSFVRAGNQFFRYGDADNAIRNYRAALELNPGSAEAHQRLGFLLFHAKNREEEGAAHSAAAVKLGPANPFAQYDLGMALLWKGDYAAAERRLSEAVRLLPGGYDSQYEAAEMRFTLAKALMCQGKFAGAAVPLAQALRVAPDRADLHYALARALAEQGGTDDASAHLAEAVGRAPAIDASPQLHDRLGINLAAAGRFEEAALEAAKALALARAAGLLDLCREIAERRELYARGLPYPPREDGGTGPTR